MPAPVKQVLFWVVAQLPYAGGVALWLQGAKAHPVGVFFIWVVYQVGVIVVGFGMKVWGELEKDAVKATADWVRSIILVSASPFRRRYNQQVIYDHRTFNVKGLRTQGTYNLRLEKVFVELRIAPSNPQEMRFNPITAQELAGNRPIWDFLRQQIKDGTALAIIGPPGSGKTTLLQHIALTFAANRQRRHKLRVYTPLLLFLRDVRNTITSENPPNLATLAEAYFTEQRDYPKPPAGWFALQLERGKCIVLLDGLDEVADPDQRRRVANWVDRQIKAYPRSLMVITARPQGYRSASLEQAHVLEIQPFNATQVHAFIQNWYLANEMQSEGGKGDAGVRQKATRSANDLVHRLRSRPNLDDLTRNPLLLTMIAMVHRYRGALPGRRVELYDEICAVLLGHWRIAKGMSDPLTAAQKRVVLQLLASYMMRKRLRDIHTDEAIKVLRPALSQVNVKDEQDIVDFLPDLQASSGLFVEREANTWNFAHLTFQEYLAAAYWLQKPIKLDWATLVTDSWWHETILLYGAQGDATSLLQACLQAGTVQALTLAAESLEEARIVDSRVRDAVHERLSADLESAHPDRRRLAAEVRLAQRLKSFQRIDDEREIDVTYITCAEYQLFLDDVRTQGKSYQPDHWVDVGFQPGQARMCMGGVRAEDANHFAAWLTLREGNNSIYRLPTTTEARTHSSSETSLATWCHTLSKYELVGLDQAIAQGILQKMRSMSTLPLPPSLNLFQAYVNTSEHTDTLSINGVLTTALQHAREHARLFAISSALDRASDRSGILAKNLTLTLERRHHLDRANALDHAYNLALLLDCANTLAKDLNFEHSSTLDRTCTLARALTLALDRASDLARACTLARDLDRDLTPIRDRAFARARACARDLAFAFASAFASARDLDLDRDLALILDHASDVALARVRALTNTQNNVGSSAEARDHEITTSQSELTRHDRSHSEQAVEELVSDLVASTLTDDLLALRHVEQQYVTHLTKYIWSKYEGLQPVYSNWSQRVPWRAHRNVPNYETERQAILELHWWLHVVLAREAGELPTWEGIRIVRERKAVSNL